MKKLFLILGFVFLYTSCCTECTTNIEIQDVTCEIISIEKLILKRNINEEWIDDVFYVNKFKYRNHQYFTIDGRTFIHDPECFCNKKEDIKTDLNNTEESLFPEWWDE